LSDSSTSSRIADPARSPGDIPSRRAVVSATLGALVVAAGVLAIAVLPAEYGIDPLGTGRALGLLDLAEGGTGAVLVQDDEFRTDTMEFVLGPYQSVEYKYRVEKDASMLYSWRATRRVMYDFHGEPDGAPKGYAESFEKQEGDRGNGTFVAPFSGIQGWYWENKGGGEVSITLTTAGFYSAPREYFDGNEFYRELKDSRGRPIPRN
jgi:hypothetical protein